MRVFMQLHVKNNRMLRLGKYIIILAVLVISARLGAQKTLEGSFHQLTDMWADEWNSFIFYADQSFFFEKESDFGDYHGYGDYELTRDSLILRFREVPEILQSSRVIEEEIRSGGGTLIQVRDALNPHEKVVIGGSVYQGDSLLCHLKGDVFGCIYLDSGLTNIRLEILAYRSSGSAFEHIYETQNLYLDHTNARSILLMLCPKSPGLAFIGDMPEVRLKARLTRRGQTLKVFPETGSFLHPTPGAVTYTLSGTDQ